MRRSTASTTVLLRILTSLIFATLLVTNVHARLTREEVLSKLAGDARLEDFNGAAAAGITITDQDLSQSNWRNADLRGAIFQRVKLDSAVFSGANLRGAIFEDVSLIDADLVGADLSGARLRLANLAGTRMDDCQITGASFQLVLLSINGGTHAEALRLALQKACERTFTRAWISGLSGDAFAFVYNQEDTGFWPGTPFTVNPVLAAARILGHEAQIRVDYHAKKQLLDSKEFPSGVHLVPLQQGDVGLWMLRNMPLWGVVSNRQTDDRQQMQLSFDLPPFGSRILRRDRFEEAWEGPWNSLEPSGAMNVRIRRPLYTIAFNGNAVPTESQVLAALRQAALIISDRRTYGPLVPGEAGLTRLAADLRAVAEGGDRDQAKRLALWEQFPRQCLLGARGEACKFLEEALPALDIERQGQINQALVLFKAEVTSLRDEWPSLSQAMDGDAATLSAALRQAADLVGKLAANERLAASLLEQAGTQ